MTGPTPWWAMKAPIRIDSTRDERRVCKAIRYLFPLMVPDAVVGDRITFNNVAGIWSSVRGTLTDKGVRVDFFRPA